MNNGRLTFVVPTYRLREVGETIAHYDEHFFRNGLMVSADDDMRPYTLVEDSPESLGDDEIARGKLLKKDARGFTRKSFDILAAFLEVLGKRVADVPPNYLHGKLARDTAMDLHTNATQGLTRDKRMQARSHVRLIHVRSRLLVLGPSPELGSSRRGARTLKSVPPSRDATRTLRG